MTPHPIARLLELLGLHENTPPITITKLPNLPEVSGRNLYITIRNLYGGGRTERRPIPRRPLPPALTQHLAAVRRLERRRLMLDRPELHDHHQLDQGRILELHTILENYITTTPDTQPGGPPIPGPADGFGVTVGVGLELDALESQLEEHQLARRWRLGDLRHVWRLESGAGG